VKSSDFAENATSQLHKFIYNCTLCVELHAKKALEWIRLILEIGGIEDGHAHVFEWPVDAEPPVAVSGAAVVTRWPERRRRARR